MRRGPKDYRIPWGSNVIDDVSGFKFKRHELRRRWDGLMVDAANWEPRQPQDFVRGIADRQMPSFVRDQIEPMYVGITWTDGSGL